MEAFAEFEQATIAAIATPAGAGGIGIIRLSGTLAPLVLARLFRPARSKSEPPRTHQLRYGWIINPATGLPLDEVMAVFMAAPATYTREDVVEIHGHGGPVVLREMLTLVLAQEGVRAAEPGEFTKRAFLNGRIDLTRAEAVLDLLNAGTRQGLEMAVAQLGGGLHAQVAGIRVALLKMLAVIEVAIDFPDDDAEIIDGQALGEQLELLVRRPLLELLDRARQGRIYREGAAVVILGRPNVGKSSLLNALLGEDRAIVTPVPGTTRDTIEEGLNIHGIPLRIIDTAGIRDTDEPVEGLGIERSRRRVEAADLVLLLVEAGAATAAEDLALYAGVEHKKVVLVLNKVDLLSSEELKSDEERVFGPAEAGELQIGDWASRFPSCPQVMISARTGWGLGELKDAIFRQLSEGEPHHEPGHLGVPNARHEAALARALPAVESLAAGLSLGQAPELLAIELQVVVAQLGEIIGEVSSDDLLDSIFSQFCLGK